MRLDQTDSRGIVSVFFVRMSSKLHLHSDATRRNCQAAMVVHEVFGREVAQRAARDDIVPIVRIDFAARRAMAAVVP